MVNSHYTRSIPLPDIVISLQHVYDNPALAIRETVQHLGRSRSQFRSERVRRQIVVVQYECLSRVRVVLMLLLVLLVDILVDEAVACRAVQWHSCSSRGMVVVIVGRHIVAEGAASRVDAEERRRRGRCSGGGCGLLRCGR